MINYSKGGQQAREACIWLRVDQSFLTLLVIASIKHYYYTAGNISLACYKQMKSYLHGVGMYSEGEQATIHHILVTLF